MLERALALTLDLDGPAEYAGIHGLEAHDVDPLVMYRGPLARFAALCRELGGKATLFVVGRDVHDDAARELRELAAEGFEIGNHTMAHDYALSRRPAAEIRADLRRAQQAIAEATGILPTGFRAPGYHLSAALMDALETVGFAYDSSVLPSPSYYGLKAAVLTLYRVLGRPSTSILGSPAIGFAPTAPYVPGDSPFVVGRRALVELPIAVATPLRLPLTGATMLLAGRRLRGHLLGAVAKSPVVVINMHAIELVDPEADGLPASLCRRQPELRRTLAQRQRILRDALAQLAVGRSLVPLAEIAASAST